ncbi:MAG: UDP-N-acetylmuramate dehydrogenase [Candidatus Omnitrophica bacterium]|nr:UDP-N-acetylmuramate dehydrogenase [Candidatus Omnitrophota bacterium]
MNSASLKQEIKKLISGEILFNEPLSRHTSFKIGGPADIWVEIKDPMEFVSLTKFLKYNSIPMHVIGGGTNVLVSDKGLRGVTISTRSYDKITFLDDGIIQAGAGVKISKLIREAMSRSLTGLEFMAGIPGTVGGAIRMNAGVKNSNGGYRGIGELVEEVGVIGGRLGTFAILSREELEFGYRDSNLKDSFVLAVRLKKLDRGDKGDIAVKVREFLGYKRKVQDLNVPSAGCIFKNVEGKRLTSGQMIETSGLKGVIAGGAQVSDKHANFIINRGNAKANDVLKLIDIIRQKVRKKHGVRLELEIELMGVKI